MKSKRKAVNYWRFLKYCVKYHACPLTLFPWELLAGIGLYQCLSRSRWCQALTSPNNFCLEKDKGNKNLEKQCDYKGQQMWEKECVCFRFKGEDFSLLFRAPCKALENA